MAVNGSLLNGISSCAMASARASVCVDPVREGFRFVVPDRVVPSVCLLPGCGWPR